MYKLFGKVFGPVTARKKDLVQKGTRGRYRGPQHNTTGVLLKAPTHLADMQQQNNHNNNHNNNNNNKVAPCNSNIINI